MALGAVLVDRARRLAKEPTKRVQGRTVMTEVDLPWFRCRIFTANPPEATEPVGGKKSTVPQPLLLFGLRDETGEPVELSPEERIEVDSRELGRSVWNVVTDPEPLRRKRSVLGYQVQVERVIERQFTPSP